MHHKQEIEIPATKAMQVVRIDCDICGREIKPEGHCEVRRTIVSITEGRAYGSDGGDTETREFDVCAECFREKLVPWISSHRGTEPRVQESNW